MNRSRARWEWVVVALAALLLLTASVPSLIYARRERVDGLRQEHIRALKNELEQRNNKLSYYPVDFNAQGYEYVVLEQEGEAAVSWYLRAKMDNSYGASAGFDEEHNVFYRFAHEGSEVFYDVCGGEFTCGVDRKAAE